MRRFEHKVPAEQVYKVCPEGSSTRLTKEAAFDLLPAWGTQIDIATKVDWKVLNYFYWVGSRKSLIGGVVIGAKYGEWVQITNELVPKTYWLIKGQVVQDNGTLRLVALRQDEYRHLIPLVLTDWNGKGYNEVVEHQVMPQHTLAEEIF